MMEVSTVGALKENRLKKFGWQRVYDVSAPRDGMAYVEDRVEHRHTFQSCSAVLRYGFEVCCCSEEALILFREPALSTLGFCPSAPAFAAPWFPVPERAPASAQSALRSLQACWRLLGQFRSASSRICSSRGLSVASSPPSSVSMDTNSSNGQNLARHNFALTNSHADRNVVWNLRAGVTIQVRCLAGCFQ